uniref:Uncharacterized protein n=1 Tax=Trichobilharzia regenti TaxID=157069 RepID=A0AA85K6P6_TRIRE|nr:unnamed protein product [Trichobilharzia regenti]
MKLKIGKLNYCQHYYYIIKSVMFRSKSSSMKFDEFLVDADLTSCSPSLYDNHFELTNGINIHKVNEFPSQTSSSLSSPLPPSLTPSSSFSSESIVDSQSLMSDCTDEIIKSKSQRPYNNMCNSDIKPIKYKLLNNESLGNICINVQFHFPYSLHNNSLLTDFYDELNSDISTSTSNTFTVSNILYSDNCCTTSTIGFPPYLDKLHSVQTTSDMLIKPKSPRVLLDASNNDIYDRKIKLTQKCNSSSDSGLYTSLPIDVRYISTRLVKQEIQMETPHFAPILNTKYIYSPSLENIENKLCTGDITTSIETDYDMSNNIQTIDTNISTLSNLGEFKNQSRYRRIETSARIHEDTSVTSTINVDEQVKLCPEKLIPLYDSNRMNPIEYSRISRISEKYVDQAIIPNAPLTYNHKHYEDTSNKSMNDSINHINYTLAGDMYKRTNEEIITSSCCLQRSSNLSPEHCCSLNSINETTSRNIPNPVNYYESVLCRQLYSTSIKKCSERYEKVYSSLKPLNSSKMYNTIPQTLLISKMEEFVQKLAKVSLIPNQLCERHEHHSNLCVEGDKQNPSVILKNDALLFNKNPFKMNNISKILMFDKQSTIQKPSFTSIYHQDRSLKKFSQCDTSTQTDNDDKVNKSKFYQHINVEHFQCPIYNKYSIDGLDSKMNSPDTNHFHAVVSPVYPTFRNSSSGTSACSCSHSERCKSNFTHKSTCEEAFTKCYSSYELHKHPIKATSLPIAKCVFCHFIDTCPGDCVHRITTCLHHGLYILSNTPSCINSQSHQSSESNVNIKSNETDVFSSSRVLHFIVCPKCSANNTANNCATHNRYTTCYRQRRQYFSTRFASSKEFVVYVQEKRKYLTMYDIEI